MRYQLTVCGVLLISSPLLSMAEPVVLYDSGRTTRLPIQPQTLHLQTPVTANFDVQIDTLPIKTPSLSPGNVVSRRIDRLYLDRPVFLVGADPLSMHWLVLHQAQLKQLHAIGLAVNVETQAQLQQLRKTAGGLEIHPLAGDAMAAQLALQHYPVLITASRIEQ
ncbi:PFL_4695 family integrating conjugative element protein [Methylomonas methanica]|uniref:Integrating conjugative element protein, PFL_4695 family n=1 Tax=Methylomonas methanica (strain DSM 25384 / MC09) TaxID=857087 RepID=G0A593_METMM|nr:integrating conjugative element protein [Methylomonas methanica]AEG00423.1 integrating conjugative element protein, PFL_4695 family [Methylomonas methanica MC09]